MLSELSSPNGYDILIVKYLDDDISSEEKELLRNWILQSKENENYFRDYVSIWEASNIILQDKKNAQIKLEEFNQKQSRLRRRKLISWATSSAAAVMLLLITLQFFTPYQWFGERVQTFTSENSKKEIVLPDGSHVWLNANSSISYAKSFERSRKVKLTGEALFDVVKSAGKNFTVETSNIKIEVLGTVFLVNDKAGSDITETVLESGLVNITINGTGEDFNLKPGELFQYNSTDESSTIEQVNASSYTGWIATSLSFTNIPMSELIIQLEKWYNIDIVCNNKSILNIPVSITIDDEPLEETLFLLSQIVSLSWSAESVNRIILN